MTTQWPTFGALKVNFAEKPQLRFKLSAVSLNLSAIAGLENFRYVRYLEKQNFKTVIWNF